MIIPNNQQITQIMHLLFDDYFIYLMIIWLIIWSISCSFVIIWFDLFEIVWCLFNQYSGSIILSIWWLFVLNYSWLFDDYLISTPAAGRSTSFISKSLRTAPWHILVMAACPRGHIAACELQQETHHLQPLPSLSLAGFDLPSSMPRSTSSVFLREVADPAVTQYLTVTITCA